MRNFTQLIKENDENKTYKYVANVKIEGEVTASSEGDAGELVDKEIDTIDGVVDYKIESLDEVVGEVKESTILESNEEMIMLEAYNKVIEEFQDALEVLPSDYYKAMLREKLIMYFKG